MVQGGAMPFWLEMQTDNSFRLTISPYKNFNMLHILQSQDVVLLLRTLFHVVEY